MFRGTADSRTIDRITTLTALGERVVFKDNKEAFIGMRVARGLEQPDDKPEIFTDDSGKPPPKRWSTIPGSRASTSAARG